MKKMKKRNWFLCALAAGLFALLFIPGGCDMAYLDNAASPGASGYVDDPGSGTGTGEDAALEELKQNGRYLMLYHLPRETIKEHVSAVRVTDGSRQVAMVESYGKILVDQSLSSSDVYIPLLAPDSTEFTRSGAFYVEFTVQIDAVTRISVQAKHNVLVEFIEGRGVLDIEKLIQQIPDIVDAEEDPEVEKQIDDIIASGGYIRFFNLARTVSASKFSSISVSNSSRVVARCADYARIAVRKNVLNAEAFVPLTAASSDLSFTETGAYYTAFTVQIDALTEIRVDTRLKALYDYIDGVTDIDVTRIPSAPDAPPTAPHSLTITGLPLTANPSNFVDVLVHNSQGIVAKCADYMQITVTPFVGGRAAVIPLVYDNSGSFNGQPFSDSGDFIVTFSFFADAFYNIIVTVENNLVISFTGGSGAVDVDGIPPAPHNYLTITNLPANLQELNIAEVFVWNQAGKVGKCRDYEKLIITNYGPTTTLRVPLGYTALDQTFLETGDYYVSFDLNVDALTRILITQTEKVLAAFTGGNGILDADKLPQAAPPPYLTIVGLPYNTAKNNFSDVFLYNAVGRVAKCASYQEILITKNAYAATAMIPLVYNDNGEYFRDSGDFIVSFTINVDVSTQIIKTYADAMSSSFTDGSGLVDLSSDYGFFSGGLVNPLGTSAPVLKRGTTFEMNGAYFSLTADTAVKPTILDLPKTTAVYVYAVSKPGGVEFEYDAVTAPVWVPEKNGWYAGDRRALYKFVYIKDVTAQYAAKTFIDDPWKKFDTTAITMPSLGNLSAPLVSLSGATNPAPQTRTLSPGAYVFIISGAGGGGGGGINGSDSYDRYGGNGGDGGLLAELVTVQSTASFTLYTSSGGVGAEAILSGGYQACGGGGGGSGSFAYSTDGYFGVAGGGGGGSGGGSDQIAGGGGGGAGGSIGKGGKGGKGGDGWFASGYKVYEGSFGGSGGGGTSPLTGNQSGYAGAGKQTNFSLFGTSGEDGENATYTVYGFPDEWKNTNGANGQGANADTQPGGYGGNNRTTTRGGGAAGGAGGIPSDSTASGGKTGGAGSIAIYRIF